jgi:RNA polymerase sigma factor (sigma-70 family)
MFPCRISGLRPRTVCAGDSWGRQDEVQDNEKTLSAPAYLKGSARERYARRLRTIDILRDRLMGRQPPPPDWGLRDERELERLFCGPDEALAGAALVELRRRHDGALQAQARKQSGGDGELSEEALQRLDVRLWEKRLAYDPDKGRWLPWARVILHNLIVSLHRDRARGLPFTETDPPGPGAAADRPAQGPAEALQARDPPPDWRLRLQELGGHLTECIQHLSPEERTALILQVLDGLSLQEIGERTGVNEQTAGSRVFRAKKKLRECLKRKGYEGGEV